ncbi:putative response regulatory protein [Paenibacillus konkukensis]|uniref:Response regulatory protein n=1 Tax=Paenibacillus konkukensis TaxID=2020716 RepID=A0ABY4RMA2_9BACL|nr:response regulator [Paenibacillus konkukensis]UQZ82991.1 putative response regulatory protein [Paenibacillus konkukensis]
MWKVIIVDDEVLVRRGLSLTIPWSKYDMQVVGDYSNGAKALEAMAYLQPDVVITDIRMPHMDGLTFLKKIRESYPETVSVILSCHDDFAYAKEAIHLGAVNYLLKTSMDETEVDLALSKVRQSLEKRKSVDALLRQAEQVRSLERQAGLRAAFKSDLPSASAAAISGRSAGDSGCFLLLMAKPVHSAGSGALFAGCRQLEQLYGRESDWYGALDEEGCLLTVLKYSGTPSSLEIQRTGHIWSGRLLQLFDCGREELYVGVSAPFVSLATARQALEEAGRGAEAFFYDEGERSFYTGEAPYAAAEDRGAMSGAMFTADRRQQFLEALRTRSPQKVRAELQQLSALWKPGVSSASVKEMAAAMIDMIRLECGDPQSSPMGAAISELRGMSKRSELVSRIGREIDAWEQRVQASGGFSLRPEIQKAVQYIQRHLQEELKMQDVAEHVELSRSHFSALFKQALDKTFLEYVMEKRMERAMELIREGRKKMYEVAYEVGFSDYKYFTRCFKEHTGATPKEWRERLAYEAMAGSAQETEVRQG